MYQAEMKVLALCWSVLLLTLSSAASDDGEGGQLGDGLLEEHMAWADEGQDETPAESKRAFHATRGKKHDDASDLEVMRALHAMRGKRLLLPVSVDSFIAQLRRAVIQGRGGGGFIGTRGKRELHDRD
ncbi:hypothetical protein MTO96_038798 [Rhipicephalus appendiculatus]